MSQSFGSYFLTKLLLSHSSLFVFIEILENSQPETYNTTRSSSENMCRPTTYTETVIQIYVGLYETGICAFLNENMSDFYLNFIISNVYFVYFSKMQLMVFNVGLCFSYLVV